MRISRFRSETTFFTPRPALSSMTLALALAFSAGQSEAAGLGRLSVLSTLGQPLSAEIELTSVTPDEASSLEVRLAPVSAFAAAKVEYGRIHTTLRLAVERRANGSNFVRITSTLPINEPFLDVLVELNGGGNRLVRNYTFLLDPPELRSGRVEPIAPAVAALPSPATATPVRPPASVVQERIAAASAPAVQTVAPAPAPAAPPVPARPASYRVKNGETLLGISRDLQLPGVTLEQMLVALFRNNETTFDGANINRLRAGSILRVPEASVAAAIPPAEAQRFFTAQSADFAAYRQSLAGSVAATPQALVAESGREAAGKITAKVEDKQAPANATRDQLKLSKAGDGKGGVGAGAAAASAETAALRERELKEASTRVALLEKTVSDLQKLIELKNRSLQELQKQAQLQGVAVPAPSAPAVAPVAAAPAAPAPAAIAAPGGTAPAKSAPPAAAKTAPAKNAGPEPSLVDELLDDPIFLAGGGGVLALLGIFVVVNQRRKKRAARFDDSTLTGHSALHTNSVFGIAGGASVDTSNSAFNSNFIPQGGQLIDSNEVDPVAEADVYIAYGRDAQAEEILKEALRTQPERAAVRLKLLELYAKRQDVKSFEAIATELYASTNGAGPEWQAAAALGRIIAPAHPLYKASENAVRNATAATVVASAADIAAGMAGQRPEGVAMGYNFESTMPGPGGEVSGGAVTSRAEHAPPAGMDLDVDLDFDSIPEPEQALVASAARSPAATDDSVGSTLDFDLDLSPTPEPVAAPEPTPAPSAAPVRAAAPVREAPALPADAMAPDMVFEFTATPAAEAAPAAAVAAPAPADDPESVIDFEFVLPSAETPAAVPQGDNHLHDTPISFDKTMVLNKSPLAGISLELDSGLTDRENAEDGAENPAWQEMATKLDLAAAYRDIGDKDGARELLDEVIKGGSNVQVQKAMALRDSLG